MTSMKLKIERILTPYNFSDKNDIGRIEFIVIHYFGSLSNAKSVAQYFANAYRGASAHYILDGGDVVYQCVEDGDIAWHCGTSGTYFHPRCRNSNSLAIEVRPQKMDQSRAGHVEDPDWFFDRETMLNLVQFVSYLMKKYNIPIDNVLRHYDVTHKQCPRPFTGDDINKYSRISGNSAWNLFKIDILERNEVREMDGKEIFEKLMEYLNSLPTSDYAKEASRKGIRSKMFTDGDKDGLVDNPRAFLTREQLAVVLNNAGLLDK